MWSTTHVNKEDILTGEEGFLMEITEKKEYSLKKKKQEDGCQGLVGFAKRVDAPILFAAILFFLISNFLFQNALNPIQNLL